jgi:superfamily II DNA or RNA helicase
MNSAMSNVWSQLLGNEVGSPLERPVRDAMAAVGLAFDCRLDAGMLFQDAARDLPVLVDLSICQRADLEYIDYTTAQNEMMARCGRLLRFAVETPADIPVLKEEVEFFRTDAENDAPLTRLRRGREITHPDPTRPEARFEEMFARAFGESALHALRREQAFSDFNGKSRFIDYSLRTRRGRIAIELNGETFHHPRCIGIDRYCSQLFKQNSLVMSGWPVFRWSERGMRDADRFIEEMRRYFGPVEDFLSVPRYMASRSVCTFQLMEHQEEALDWLSMERQAGRTSFLIELPTGTGKTEIFMEDFRREKERDRQLNGLILVPTTKLRDQTLERLAVRVPGLSHGNDYQPPHLESGFMVQTYQHMIRHFQDFAPNAFRYVVVDEAHHAMAPGLRSVLEHLDPTDLVGLTATPDRHDLKPLAEVFGTHETRLTLREAIESSLLPPIRAFRIETNLDLSEVRYNGKDYSPADLQRCLRIPARDAVVADVMEKSFGPSGIPKQGVVFCVDLRHARVMADLLSQRGINAAAVSGTERLATTKALDRYHAGEVQFLCACELLTEGWDSPQTSVLVMARPTMSKVLYVQQLGRGTRSHPGKEALYVLDVVDRHGPLNAPWSVHALFGVSSYAPWADVVASASTHERMEQELLLGWLPDRERTIREIDIFTFQSAYEGYLNEEQLARELFVSTGTIKNWLRRGELHPDVEVPMGARTLRYFAPNSVAEIRAARGLKVHDDSTQYDDLFEFLGERDYTFSYKMVFLLAFFECANTRGESKLEFLVPKYAGFYADRRAQRLSVERPNSPYNRPEMLADGDAVRRSILENPFEKFERKRFMHHCKDLAYIAWTSGLWAHLRQDLKSLDAIHKQLAEDLSSYYRELGGLGDTAFLTREFPRIAQYLGPPSDASAVASAVEPDLVSLPGKQAYKTFLPYFPIHAAASGFLGGDASEPFGWLNVATRGFVKPLEKDMFVCRVVGRSMEPTIPDGSLCVFRSSVGGTRQGRVLLVQKRDLTDPETGGSYTVKRYRSSKTKTTEGWTHESIELIPDNKEFFTLRFVADEEAELRVIAEFVGVLKAVRARQQHATT